MSNSSFPFSRIDLFMMTKLSCTLFFSVHSNGSATKILTSYVIMFSRFHKKSIKKKTLSLTKKKRKKH